MKEEILKNKWALVTGASSGLGADFARQLASLGCHLVLVARRQDRLKKLKEEINTKSNVTIKVLPMDLSVPEAPQHLYNQLNGEGVNVDVLINNAGFGMYGKFLESDWERTNQMIQLNAVTLAHLTWLFARDMANRKFGFILQVASNGAYQSTPLYAAYSASKSFVLHLSEAINYEMKGTGVTCTAISPGVTITEFHQVAGQNENSLYYRLTKKDSPSVARAGIKAILKGRPSIIPGWMVALTAGVCQRAPRNWVTAIIGRLMAQGG